MPDSKKVLFVADMFAGDSNGGAELTSAALLEASPYDIQRAYCTQITPQFVSENKNSFWIFGNFASLHDSMKLHFAKNEQYSVIEYDYKYCKFRSDDLHKLVEKECTCENEPNGKLNSIFFSKAQCTWWMSENQKNYYIQKFPFLEKSKNIVLSSVFDKTSIEYFEQFSLLEGEKNENWIILNSPSWIKNVEGCKKYAEQNNLSYELVWNMSHSDVLEKLAKSKGLISLPTGKDTCPRLVIEAKLLDCELVMNENVQHKDEPWFQDKDSILQHMKERKAFFWDKIGNMSNNYKIIVPLYNVEEWIDKCVKSIKLQDYENYECYLIDDISTDSTGDIIKNLIEGDNRFHYIRNTEKKYALRNIYEAVELSGNDSEDIIVTLDGDDWFATKKCLSTLNEKYDSTGCHITYGSYIEYPSMAKGPFCREIPSEIVKNQSYRKHRWVSSHLRTFKRHLWNRIEKHDLLDQDGNFYQMTWDMAFMFPMLEMAGPLSLHIPEILYSYNRQNPLNDDKVNHALQLATENTIRNKNVYKQGFVTCNILGPSGDMSGIGNQLFCVATTLSYALDNDCTPFFLQMGSDNHIKKYKNNFYKNLPIGSHDVSHSIYAEKNFHYDAIPEGQNNLKMHGYFQSEKYFNNNREKIISLLNAPALKEQATQKYGDYSNHISIHVRRGDYLELSDFHHNLSIDYYKNAIDKFDKNSKYLVFSNDIEWCKDNFDFIENVEFSTCEEDWEDIVLMSNCQHNIIANSSFSWWGAWLNENPNKKVICPSKWFGPKFSNKDTKDLLSPSWTII